MRFLVDSGADVSIIPATPSDTQSSDYKLYAANGTEIETYGIKMLTLDLGLRREFQWPFIVAKINKGILGADFLNKFHLLIDLNQKKLLDGITQISVTGDVASISEDSDVSSLNKANKFSNLLEQYPDISRPNLFISNIKHNVSHHIITNGQPVYSKARQLDSKRLETAKQEFKFMLDNDIIRPSSSQWSSPLHLVTKKDGTLRPCGDYRQLNARTVPDRYPIPRIEDFHHILKDSTIYSKIDLFKAYFQVPIAEEDKCKTAIITPFGLYEFNVMSFGLKNAPATFQRFINEVFSGLNFVFPYLDDILIASTSEEQHEIHLKLVFERLNNYGLRINISKSVFGVEEINFLGYFITSQGSRPLPDKVQIIIDYKLPTTIHDLRTFLGMINFYRRYLKDAAKHQSLLHDYLKGARKRDKRQIKWTEEAIEQFNKCKEDLAHTALLSFPTSELPLSLSTDASDTAIGAVIQQYESDGWKPIAFYSKKLNEAQKNYSTYDRELLGIYLSIKHFKHLLEGRRFIIFTDHKPITFAFQQKPEKASPRQFRHLQYISEFSTDIRHIKGQDNIIADTLSRIEEISLIDYDAIADEQNQDEELKTLQTSTTSLNFKQCPLPSGKYVWCETSTSNIRPYIPKPHRMPIFQQIHGASHPGIKASVKLLTSKFFWTNIRKDVRQWAKTCIPCQKSKINRHTKSSFGEFQLPSERFSDVHIDLIGPLPPSNGNIYCLTCIDRYSNWMEVIPLQNMLADTVARAFYSNWISRFGTPCRLVTDRGSQFGSEVFQTLSRICGIKLQHTTAYHPQANGKVERLHRSLKAAITAHGSPAWSETLPTILLGLRTAIQSDSNHTIAQMVYGQNIRLPGEFFQETKITTAPETFANQLQKTMEFLRPRTVPKKHTQKIFIPKDLKNTSHVFVRKDRVKKQLEPPYDGPFPVTARTDKYFTLQIKGKLITVSIDRLKPAYILQEHIPDTSGFCEHPSTLHESDETEKTVPKLTIDKQTRSGRTIRMPVRFQD